MDESILRQKIESALEQKNQILVKIYNRKAVDAEEVVQYFLSYADRLAPMLIDASTELNKASMKASTYSWRAGRPPC